MIEGTGEKESGGEAQRGNMEAGEGKPARSGSKMRGAEVAMDGDDSGGEDGDKTRGGGERGGVGGGEGKGEDEGGGRGQGEGVRV